MAVLEALSTMVSRAENHRSPAIAAAGRRRDTLAYICLGLGLVLYILAIWGQVYLDTHATQRSASDVVSESHRHWRLRTALVFLIWSVLGGLTLPFGIGWLVLIPAYAWYLYRVIKGAVYFRLGRPVGVAKAFALAQTRL